MENWLYDLEGKIILKLSYWLKIREELRSIYFYYVLCCFKGNRFVFLSFFLDGRNFLLGL